MIRFNFAYLLIFWNSYYSYLLELSARVTVGPKSCGSEAYSENSGGFREGGGMIVTGES